MRYKEDLEELLNYIDPASLIYQDWLNVGMALKHEGYPVSVWDTWSMGDSGRYKRGDCEKKWESFNEASSGIVTAGTIYHLAVSGGYGADRERTGGAGHALDWGGEISKEEVVVDANWIESKELHEPDHWDPVQQVIDYIETLFAPSEYVGFAMQSRLEEKHGKYVPRDAGSYSLTAGKIIESLRKEKQLGAMGSYDPKAGAWIRFNPLDGKGVGNKNVTDYRYALIESDNIELEKQNALIRELELPVAIMVYSGGKSIHAIVKIDAADYAEYRKRVDYLYDICKKNGLEIDTQNRNPSRLSRLPGVMRGDKKQYIIDKNIGKETFDEWKDWIESVNDSLPDFEDLSDIWENIPALAPELISGILRKGHKMLIAGPSKAGKSFLQIELAISIAEGLPWLGHKCAQGRVLYVNLELDRASCLHRFRDVYNALNVPPASLHNIDIWNLRGKSVPLDQLVPKLVRRAQKRKLMAVIIDPIYKVITGDENSAEQMAKFCNQFDKICAELECAAIYCHHHSKGAQGGKKSMDRASGSGVFARDPDAQLDLIELPVSDDIRKQQTDRAICDRSVVRWAAQANRNYREEWSQDDVITANKLVPLIENDLPENLLPLYREDMQKTREREQQKTAWQISATLREFPGFDPINMWFDYPVHRIDDIGVLKDVKPEAEKSSWERAKEARQKNASRKSAKQHDEFVIAYKNLAINGDPVKLSGLAKHMNKKQDTVSGWIGSKNTYGLADEFESYRGEDGHQYVRQKPGQERPDNG